MLLQSCAYERLHQQPAVCAKPPCDDLGIREWESPVPKQECMHLDADVHARSQRQRPGVRADDANILVPALRPLSVKHTCVRLSVAGSAPVRDVHASHCVHTMQALCWGPCYPDFAGLCQAAYELHTSGTSPQAHRMHKHMLGSRHFVGNVRPM